jgi:hypothetical protein
LLAITLPSATYPLDLVKGWRFLEARKKDPKLEPDKSLPDPVLKLLNYPDVVKMMNDDLDWTEALGEAVDTNEAGVMDAIQAFRRKAQGAGNLKSNDKQVVKTEQEAIVIEPANPEVIYVPQYQPSSVVVYSPTPYAWGYYPTPYPYYAYPYAPGAALATGLIVGAAIGGAWGMGWNNGSINNNINIDRNTNINTGNRNNINTGNRPSQGGGGQNWRNDRAPTQTKAGAQARQGSVGSRPGDARGGAGASARPTSMGGAGASARPTNMGGAGASARDGAGSVRASSPASNYGGGRDSGGAGSMQGRSLRRAAVHSAAPAPRRQRQPRFFAWRLEHGRKPRGRRRCSSGWWRRRSRWWRRRRSRRRRPALGEHHGKRENPHDHAHRFLSCRDVVRECGRQSPPHPTAAHLPRPRTP